MPKGARNTTIRRHLGMNLKYGRTLLGLTQEQLAERVNVDRSLVGAIERGTSGASIDSLVTLGAAIHVPAHVLIMPPAEAHPLILAGIQPLLQKAQIDGLIEGKNLPAGKKRKRYTGL